MPDPNAGSWETSDMGTAAYVHMEGLRILGSQRERPGGRFLFRFADPDNKGFGLQVEYLNSKCRQFDAAVRSLKKLCYDGNKGRRQG